MKLLVWGCLFLASLHLNAKTFTIVNLDLDTKSKFYFQFSSKELLKSVIDKDISIKDYREDIESGFLADLKDVLNCSSLKDDQIVEECVKEIQYRENSILLVLPHTFLRLTEVNDEINDYQFLLNLLNSEEVHPKIRAYFQAGYTFFHVSDFAFYNTKTDKVLRSIINHLKLYLKNYDSEPVESECMVTVLRDTASISNGSFEGDFSECLQKNMEMIVLANNLRSITDESEEATAFEGVHPTYIEKFNQGFPQEKLLELYSISQLAVYKKGQVINIITESVGLTMRYALAHLENSFLNEYQDSLLYLINTKPYQNVSYNGQIGYHEYLSFAYGLNVMKVATSLSLKPEKIIGHVKKNQLEKYFQDTNTDNELSRLELIDLITNFQYRNIMNSGIVVNDSSPRIGVAFKNFLKSSLHSLLNSNEENNTPLYISDRSPRDEGPIFYCFNKVKNSSEEGNNFPIRYIHEINYSYSGRNTGGAQRDDDAPAPDGRNNPQSEFEESYICNGKNFTIKKEQRIAAPLKLPNKINITDGYVDILLPYALTDELNDDFKKLLITYFSSLRYKIKKEKIENTKSFFAEEMVSTDVIIPAGHSLASRDLSIGTKKAELLVLTRKKGLKDKYGVRIKLILPDREYEGETINIQELAEAYTDRMEKNSNPLFVFVISCFSEQNINTWSLIYRRAIDIFGKDTSMLPHVIASTRGFPTSSNTDIAGSIFYPSDVADLLARGKNPSDVNAWFEVKEYKSLAKEYTSRLGRAWLPWRKGLGDIFKDPEEQKFKPTYNLSDENRDMILRTSGSRYTVEHEGDIIFDETY